MASGSSKRKRTTFVESPTKNTTQNKKSRSEPSHDPLWGVITSLPTTTKDFLIYDACKEKIHLLSSIHQAQIEIIAASVAEDRARPIVDFDRYSKECWHVMTKKYTTKSTSKTKLTAKNVCKEVDGARKEILAKAGPFTRYETRRNALEVFRRICKSMLLCGNGELANELVEDGSSLLKLFVESMVQLARELTVEGRERYREEGFYEKLVELKDIGSKNMKNLSVIYGHFDGDEKPKEMSVREGKQKEEDHDRKEREKEKKDREKKQKTQPIFINSD